MKKRTLICLVLVSQAFTTCIARQPSPERVNYHPVTRYINHHIGETKVQIVIQQYGPVKSPVYINLHDDEMTSVNGAIAVIQKKGGTLIRIENNGQRNIRFKLAGRIFTFDPNRIFSVQGISGTLETYGRTSNAAVAAVDRFSRKILSLLPARPGCIVALHNNSDGKFSVTSYLPGQAKAKDAKKVYLADGEDDDDIFLTTDSLLYSKLVSEKYNTILQDNKRAKKDGSLSIYFGERNISYLNCETEHGRLEQYTSMIEAAGRHIYSASTTSQTIQPPVAFEKILPTGRKFIVD